ncbi:hypothetical protein M413DRAFT_77388 [Hebeloma cylindrosporum]|uniref:ferric-chelate reductase (NADPH) n=1 Tax=Hebeloma cylindrosporum TaxID=76867 RepID=A0A0C3BYR9_HEBCY|nr:hypothetical protein M413DRAFT_77388 [Hebeloma cylindrosporum h7]
MLPSINLIARTISFPSLGNVDAVVNPDKNIRNARIVEYPKQALYFIASFIALVSLCHFFSLGYRYATRNRFSDVQRRDRILLSRLPIALVDTLRALFFRQTIPIGSSFTLNLAELCLILGYLGVLFSWTFVNSTSTTGLRADPQYYADRAGRIAASQLPVVIALGMRNNIISWFTGVSFDKLNNLHRISVRILCILIWIHGGGRVRPSYMYGLTQWLHCGPVAGSALSLLVILTIRPVRQRNYELFLLVHFVLVLYFIGVRRLPLFIHKVRRVPYYGWPSMVMSGLERLLRLIRLVVYNFSYFNPFGSNDTKSQDATVDVLTESVLRVTIHRPSHFHWRSGQSVYLSFPSVNTYPLQAHPFTIATIDEADEGSFAEKRLIFIFRVRNGFTKNLMHVASPDATYRVFINGPYSSPPLLVGYNTVLLIAGGTGITFTLPLFLNLISRAKRDERPCQKVLFVWAIRRAEHICWIEDILMPALIGIPSSTEVAVKIYVTKSEKDSEKEESSVEELDPNDSSRSQRIGRVVDSEYVSFTSGRPDLQDMNQREIEKASGRMSINACGPHGLGNTVRKAVRTPRLMDILRGGPTINLHIEKFGSVSIWIWDGNQELTLQLVVNTRWGV